MRKIELLLSGRTVTLKAENDWYTTTVHSVTGSRDPLVTLIRTEGKYRVIAWTPSAFKDVPSGVRSVFVEHRCTVFDFDTVVSADSQSFLCEAIADAVKIPP